MNRGAVCAVIGVLVVAVLVVHLARSSPSAPLHVLAVNSGHPGADPEIGALAAWLEKHDAIAADQEELFRFWNYREPANTEWIELMCALTTLDGRRLAPRVRPLVRHPAIDVGGNRGVFATQIGGDVTVWDQPHVVAGSTHPKSIGGNFLVDPVPSLVGSIPTTFRTAICKSVLHDLSTNEVRVIVRKLTDAVERVIVVEVMQPLDEAKLSTPYFAHLRPFAHLFRRPEQYVELFKAEGFVLAHRFADASIMYVGLVFDRQAAPRAPVTARRRGLS